MSFYVQRNYEEVGWRSETQSFPSLGEAKQHALSLNIGWSPEALRVVDDEGKVASWVGRNGYRPGSALPAVKLSEGIGGGPQSPETFPYQQSQLLPVPGANIPEELAWQEGKTAGEIALIRFVFLTKDYLKEMDAKKEYLLKEAELLLKMYGVE